MDINSKFQEIATELNKIAKPPEIMLASKMQSVEQIVPFLQNGHRLFGENRVQEAKNKWPNLLQQYPDCRLHLIGPLQTNKVKYAMALFNVIQSLDRIKLADKIASVQNDFPKRQYLIQVNIGKESQKSGVIPEDLSDFYNYCTSQHDLDVIGLMCIPPVNKPAETYFKLAKQLCDNLDLPELSMGMSSDYLQAAEFGATIVRIGSAVFGERV